MKTSRQMVGSKGEDEACSYLVRLGHLVLKRNWRYTHLEIDIITLKDNTLHFVEVKTRVAPIMANPELNVTYSKQRKLINAANAFLYSKDRQYLPTCLEIFFDVLTVVFDGQKVEVEYYPQAFTPIYA